MHINKWWLRKDLTLHMKLQRLVKQHVRTWMCKIHTSWSRDYESLRLRSYASCQMHLSIVASKIKEIFFSLVSLLIYIYIYIYKLYIYIYKIYIYKICRKPTNTHTHIYIYIYIYTWVDFRLVSTRTIFKLCWLISDSYRFLKIRWTTISELR